MKTRRDFLKAGSGVVAGSVLLATVASAAELPELRISATGHGVGYMPEYFAEETGLFRKAGVKVTSFARDPWTGVLVDLDSKEADVALGGLWVPGMYYGSRRKYTVFAQMNHQFVSTIVTREPVEDFQWSWLKGRTLLAPGSGGSAPYAFPAGLMREAGVDPAGTRFIRDLSTGMLAELFEAGLGDAIVADWMTALKLQQKGAGHVAVELAKTGGIMPNSVYYCRTDRFAELEDRLVRFTKALAQSMQSLAKTPVASLEPLMKRHWPNEPLPILREACARSLASSTWSTVRIDPAASDRWMRILLGEGLVTAAPAYRQLVDTRIMDAVGA